MEKGKLKTVNGKGKIGKGELKKENPVWGAIILANCT